MAGPVIEFGGLPFQTSVLDAERARLAAMADGAIDTLDALIADTALYIHSSGHIDTKQEYLTKLATGEFRYAAVTAEDHRITDLGSAAAVTYRMAAVLVSSAGTQQICALGTAIWRPFGAVIRMAMFQSTALPTGE